MATHSRSGYRFSGAATFLAFALAACGSTKPADDELDIPAAPPASGEIGDAGGSNSWEATGSPTGDAQRMHTVKKGDTIYNLARQYYAGDIHKWRAIYEANRDQVPDPNKLKVGQVLTIPD